jgi:hypothetical protein
MIDNDETEFGDFVVRLRGEEWQDVLDAVRSGDMAPVNDARQALRSGRAALLNAIGHATTDRKRSILSELLVESRASEADLGNAVRAAQDDIHAQHMAELAATSNEIAGEAETTARALKFWTVVLAGATVVLALATIALIIATLHE